ncbi:Protein kinase-like domain-containing protein [Rozella allomycis CSF55]|uniref:Protein kinase-like domain-containing protein n=1 Tax=Rozella allomycis (strain CSF55) TaxID=988480 RepID=A0A075AR24_ROZAC|nr:Protein kinase-like domain-containing protein [Rozella allomycis CSF55]|eukprot:EPZ31155.1 Protein kinase-like domain-containing protein [Rozella allomycis CSF55]
MYNLFDRSWQLAAEAKLGVSNELPIVPCSSSFSALVRVVHLLEDQIKVILSKLKSKLHEITSEGQETTSAMKKSTIYVLAFISIALGISVVYFIISNSLLYADETTVTKTTINNSHVSSVIDQVKDVDSSDQGSIVQVVTEFNVDLLQYTGRNYLIKVSEDSVIAHEATYENDALILINIPLENPGRNKKFLSFAKTALLLNDLHITTISNKNSFTHIYYDIRWDRTRQKYLTDHEFFSTNKNLRQSDCTSLEIMFEKHPEVMLCKIANYKIVFKKSVSEYKTYKKLERLNLVEYVAPMYGLAADHRDRQVFTVCKYFPRGDLYTLSDVGSQAIKSIYVQMATALREMHLAKFVVRDIKPQNFVYEVDENGDYRVYMIDLGSFTFIHDVCSHRSGYTKAYVAPEVTRKKCEYLPDFSEDIYSLGKSFASMQKRISRWNSRKFNELIEDMTSKYPDERPSIDEVLKALKSLSSK